MVAQNPLFYSYVIVFKFVNLHTRGTHADETRGFYHTRNPNWKLDKLVIFDYRLQILSQIQCRDTITISSKIFMYQKKYIFNI